MDPCQQSTLITLLSNAISARLTTDELAQAASLLTQLGTTLGFLATQRAFCEEQAKKGQAPPLELTGEELPDADAQILEESPL